MFPLPRAREIDKRNNRTDDHAIKRLTRTRLSPLQVRLHEEDCRQVYVGTHLPLYPLFIGKRYFKSFTIDLNLLSPPLLKKLTR